jgi:hypothetical protein
MDADSKKADATPTPASSPDDLVKDLDARITEEEKGEVKGGRIGSDIFAKLGDIKGE